jgi:drug/metabolite transporter (DMT)-like permease
MSVFLAASMYVVGGATGTLCSQLAVYMGVGDPKTGLVLFFFYFGWLLSSWFVRPKGGGKEDAAAVVPLTAKQLYYIGLFATLRLAGTALSIIAIDYAGSSIFQLVYSSVPLFAAMAGKLFFGRNINKQQTLSLVVIVAGLYASTLGAESASRPLPAKGQSEGADALTSSASVGAGSIALGVVCSLMCAVSQALTGALTEMFISNHAYVQVHDVKSKRLLPPPPMNQFIFYVSAFCLLYTVLYIVVFVLPEWNSLVLHRMDEMESGATQTVLVYALVALFSLTQNVGFFRTIESKGSTFVGVIGTLVTVVIFSFSSFFFCSSHREQCSTVMRSLACMVVVSGVLAFALSKEETPTMQPTEPQEKVVSILGVEMKWRRSTIESRLEEESLNHGYLVPN